MTHSYIHINRILKPVVFALLMLSVIPAMAQPADDVQLATHYFQEGEFEKALMYFEKLYDESPDEYIYQQYLVCLVELDRLDEAEKLAKKQLRKDKKNVDVLIDLGYLYKLQGDEKKAYKQYDEVLKHIQPSRNNVVDVANKFSGINEYDYAIEAYEQGKKMMKGAYSFNFEIASIYGAQGNYEKMVDEYLELLEVNPGYKQTIQNALNRTLNFEENEEHAELIRKRLLQKVQKNPNNIHYNEMLIWFYMQKEDFKGAYIQAKALDKRKDEKGKRIFELGKVCRSNEKFDLAVTCFEYVIELGEQSPYYYNARSELLGTMNQKITSGLYYTEEDILKLERNYIVTLDEFGKSPRTVNLMKELARLKAFFLDKPKESIDLLEYAIALPRLNDKTAAELKLELADILLYQNQIWDASLYYSQVEKDFKHDAIGHEAKLRNAKLSYYNGDFGWAQSQLDVLKASTSKLIANDALKLSLLITDNLGLDTSATAMEMYARADFYYYRNMFDRALKTLDSIPKVFPSHSLVDEVYYKKYQISMKQNQYEEAKDYLAYIIKYHGDDVLADKAVYYTAELYHYVFEDLEQAQNFYRKVITEYPASLYVVESRKRFRKLRGDEM